MTQETVNITLNGEPTTIAANQTINDILKQLKLTNVLVAVEINKSVVRRIHHATTIIHENDVVEVVHFVGGG
ncbi:MAG: sulfur carrier protein ThiS [Myxococcales bacterium]|nr:sulfur carrier protein ThiS [Myxococcales bacterium]